MSGYPNPGYGTLGYGQGGYGNEPIETLPSGYYFDLLTSEWISSPKLNALLRDMLKKFDDVSQCLVSLATAFDLDSAAGVQLDMLGSIAGASRIVGFQPSGGVSPVLTDDAYRLYIKAKIAQNQWDGTIGSLYPVWAALFPGGQIVIEDQQNMTVNVTMTGVFNSITQDLVTHGYIVPRPEGVEYTYLFLTLPAFGFDSAPGYIAGFDTGHWA